MTLSPSLSPSLPPSLSLSPPPSLSLSPPPSLPPCSLSLPLSLSPSLPPPARDTVASSRCVPVRWSSISHGDGHELPSSVPALLHTCSRLPYERQRSA